MLLQYIAITNLHIYKFTICITKRIVALITRSEGQET